jgi:hypothetical protein
MGVMRESHSGERGKRLGIRLAAGQRPKSKGYVLQDAQMREEGEALEHQPSGTKCPGLATSWPSSSTRPKV